MDGEIYPGGLEDAGASLGYISYRQDVRSCYCLRTSCPQFWRALSERCPTAGHMPD